MSSRLTVAVLTAAIAASACGVIPAPPPPLETDFVPSFAPSFTPDAAAGSDGFTLEQHLAVRIRVDTCDGWATGSGWMVSPTQVVTNTHVVEGAMAIEITTYDGQDIPVTSSMVAPVADLALLEVATTFTEYATVKERVLANGDPVTIVGYPDGDKLTVEEGVYLGLVPDDVANTGEDVWGFKAHVEPGSSGSPVFDQTGAVIAVVYAGDEKASTMAWPISWFKDAQEGNLWQANPPAC